MKFNSIQPLDRASDIGEFGGKATNLAKIFNSGISTAAGYVIGTKVFQQHLHRLDLNIQVDKFFIALESGDYDYVKSNSLLIRQCLLECELDETLVSELRQLLSPNIKYVVRSSAPGEDGSEYSFAGQFDSFLNCNSLETVSLSIKKVWASLFGDRALSYAINRKNLPYSMAVIVQQQVEAVLSGVMFTCDPRPEHQNSLLVEYCSGLGERMVSGEIVPGRVSINRDDATIIVDKCTDYDTPISSITNENATTLLDTAIELETTFDATLDVEWSIDRNMKLIVLQARPITASFQSEPRVVWTNANIAENFPDPVCPLLQSFIGRGYTAYFRGLGVAFGISRKRIALMSDALEQIVDFHAERPYYNLTNIHTVLHLAPGGPWLARFFNQFTGAETFPTPKLTARKRWSKWIEPSIVSLNVVWRYLLVGKSLKYFEEIVDDFAAKADPKRLKTRSPEELSNLLDQFLDIRLNQWTGAALADTAAMVCYGVLTLLLRDDDPNIYLKGLPELESAIPVEKLWDLSRLIRNNNELYRMMQQNSAEDVLTFLQNGEFPDFYSKLDDYFDHWGFRYSGELTLSRATPREDPVPTLRLLKSFADMEAGGPAEVIREQALAREEATRLTKKRLGFFRSVLFSTAIRATQGAICLRERARMKQALLYTRLRHVALALGNIFKKYDWIDQPEDILYFSLDEVASLCLQDKETIDKTRKIVDLRKARLTVAYNQNPPDNLVLSPKEQWYATSNSLADTPLDKSLSLSGIGACGGMASGPAAVVLDVTDIDRIQSDQILVTRQTDPGWAAAFFMISGLVVERGGMLSHGAIIAREYGIPAVVGVGKATQLINNGQILRVCGDDGRVEYVHP